MMFRVSFFIVICFFLSVSHGLIAFDKLERGETYSMQFKIKTIDKMQKRFVGFFVSKSLNADMELIDPNDHTLVIVSGISGNSPKEVTITQEGTYTVNIKSSSGSGKFLMFFGNQAELDSLRLKNKVKT